MADSRFRNKCRTCRYLAVPDSAALGGYCWQTDDYLKLEEFHGSELVDTDMGCIEGWEPTNMLMPLFYENLNLLGGMPKEVTT